MFGRLALACSLLTLASCSTRTEFIDGATLDFDAAVGDAGRDAGSDAGPPVDAGPRIDDVLIYAHSRDTLYTFSAFTNTVTEIGRFTLPDGSDAPFMLDIAVDSEGVVFTSSDTSLYLVDEETATVTVVGDFGLGGREQLFALSFLTASESPGGTETLIGATNEGAYYEVDRTNANTTLLGSYPDGWSSSGDIVSVEGLGTFATLRHDDFTSDVLARIIFESDGTSAVFVIGPTRSSTEDFRALYGLGYWGADLFGFSNSGQLLRINRITGAAEVVSTTTGSDQFWGAGVTTIVPFFG